MPGSMTEVTRTQENEDDIGAADDQSGIQQEDQQPLLEEDGIFKRSLSMRFLLIGIFALILAGGCAVLIWLLITSGIIDGGGGVVTTFRLVNRTSWGAKSPLNKTPLPNPPATHAIIIHTESETCDKQDTCSAIVREIQTLQMEKRHFDDISYNFLVGGDGRVYEGRGWDIQGAFAKRVNNISLGIAFIGSFSKVAPPEQQLVEAQTLLTESLKRKKLTTDYILLGHRQVSETDSPGQALYDIIKTWPHWKDCYMDTC